jgi:hypothetical protein
MYTLLTASGSLNGDIDNSDGDIVQELDKKEDKSLS